MIAVDTSVVVAAFASWHERHEQALDVLDDRPLLPAHAALETYSVLTRLPPPLRVDGDPVAEFLSARFPEPWPALDGDGTQALLAEIRDAGVSGGATYDALVGATARRQHALLVSFDARAAATYAALGVDFRLVEP